MGRSPQGRFIQLLDSTYVVILSWRHALGPASQKAQCCLQGDGQKAPVTKLCIKEPYAALCRLPTQQVVEG